MRHIVIAMTLTFGMLVGAASAAAPQAGAAGKAAREAAEYVISRFGRQAAKEGAEALASRIAKATARHGDEFIHAVRKVGPRAFELVEHAGPQAGQAVKLLARHGEDAAVWVVTKPKAMSLVGRYGDNAAAVLVKHKAVAEPLIEHLGQPAVHALQGVGPQAGRRLAMLHESGELAKLGRSEELLGVIGKYGDKAMEFVWKHKGALAATAVLTAFLADPEPFINGARDMTGIVAENAVRPLAEAPGKALEETARGMAGGTMNWTLVVLFVVGSVVAVAAFLLWFCIRRVQPAHVAVALLERWLKK